MRRETAKIMLLNSSTAKLADVLMMPGIEMNLLSTQTLLAHGIENSQWIHETEFYKKDNSEIVVKDFQEEKINYLTWIWDKNALFNKTAR